MELTEEEVYAAREGKGTHQLPGEETKGKEARTTEPGRAKKTER